MKLLIGVCITLLALMANTASAFEKETFSKEKFDQYQKAGVSTLVDVYATWCSTCAAQQEILDQYFTKHPESKIKVLVIDFDQQKEWVKHFRAPRQSSLYIYNNNKQVWFSVAELRKEKIFNALRKWDK